MPRLPGATTAFTTFVVLSISAASVAAQQTNVSLSPFVTFLPTAGASPLAGLAFTLAGDGKLAFRAGANRALDNSNTTSGIGAAAAFRPWGADADAMFTFRQNAFSRSLSPYVFTGIGVTGRDSAAVGVTRSNWSYGAGLSVPFGRSVDVFGEERWRMSRYVLPTAATAPSPQSEFRFGLSFHFGSGSSNPTGRRGRRDMTVGDATCVDSSGPPLLRSGLSVLRH